MERKPPILNGRTAGAPAPSPVAARLDYVPQRVERAVELDMGDGLVLYDDESSLVHHLNPSAMIVWRLCNGTASIKELAEDIAAEYDRDASVVRSQVAVVVAEFDVLGLVEDRRADDA